MNSILDNDKRVKRAIITLVIAGLADFALFFVKMYIGLSVNSLAVLSDAINNLSDVLSCIIAIVSFALVKRRESRSLAFGYGRMEYVADFLMSVIIVIVGFVFVYLAVERLILPYLMTFTWLYFGIIAGTAAVKIGMGFFFRYSNKGIDSGVLKASELDSFTDAGITVMSLIGFALGKYAKFRLDAIFGLAISGIMIANGIKLLISSVKTLLGEKLDETTVGEIKAMCEAHDCIEEISDVHIHRYGAAYSEVVLDAVFTKDSDYGTIEKTVALLSAEIKNKYGYEPKICIRGER